MHEALRAAAALIPAVAVDWVADPPERLRDAYASARRLFALDYPAKVEQIAIGDGLLFLPGGARRDRAILFFHGGGWVVGSPQTHRVIAALLALESGMPVFAASYGLAPEVAIGGQAARASAALAALLAGDVGGLRPERIGLAGDSAGAAVCFWAVRGARPVDAARVVGLASFYGAFGLRDSTNLRALGPGKPGLDADAVAAMYDRLDPDGRWYDPAFDPLTTPFRPDPPSWILEAADDPLRDDSRRLAERLGADAVLTTVAAPHGFLHFAGRVAEARAVLRDGAGWLRARWGD